MCIIGMYQMIMSTEIGPPLFEISKNDHGSMLPCQKVFCIKHHDVGLDDVSRHVKSVWLKTEYHTRAASVFASVWKDGVMVWVLSTTLLRDLCIIRAEFRDKLVNIVEHLPAISRYILQAWVETRACTHAHQSFFKRTIFLTVLAFRVHVNAVSHHWKWRSPAREKIFRHAVFRVLRVDRKTRVVRRVSCVGQRGLMVEVISAAVVWRALDSLRLCFHTVRVDGNFFETKKKSVFIRISVYKVQRTELIRIKNWTTLCQADTITAPAWLIMLLLIRQRCVYSLFQLPSSGPRKSVFRKISLWLE